MSENKDALIEQYKTYLSLKDAFTNRSFATNKFFLVLLVVLFYLLATVKNTHYGFGISFQMVISFFGMFMSVLWWSNVDTYGMFNGIKIRNVVEPMEEQLAFECHKKEFQELQELRKQKKAFMFSDVQKFFATATFIIFMVIFFYEIVPIVYYWIN